MCSVAQTVYGVGDASMFEHSVARLGSVSFFEIFAAVGTAISIFWGGVKLGRLFTRRSVTIRLDQAEQKAKREAHRADFLEVRFSEIKQVLDGSVDFWLGPAKYDLGEYIRKLQGSIPIILIANFKGGRWKDHDFSQPGGLL
jgi:hypothetical protein